MSTFRHWGKWCGKWLAVFFYVLMLPTNSHAHAQIQGMSAFTGGFIHPLITPPHLLTLMCLGLWLGQHRPLRLRTPMLLIALFSGVGLLMTTQVSMRADWQPLLIGIALGIAFLVALSTHLPAWASALIFATAALAIGLDSRVDAVSPTTNVAVMLLATWLSVNLCILNFSYYISLCPQRKWVQIGIRVAGSWIAAICLLVLAFSLKENSLFLPLAIQVQALGGSA